MKTAGKMMQPTSSGCFCLDSHNEVARMPNPDAIRVLAFFNTEDAGSIVLEVPAAGDDGSSNGNTCDVWQMPPGGNGSLWAPTRARGGEYLLLLSGHAASVFDAQYGAPACD